jgi:hypothetical protein
MLMTSDASRGYQTRSMILTSQLPVARWHEQIGGVRLPSAILFDFAGIRTVVVLKQQGRKFV